MAGNIYKNARHVAGFTQEKWAEALGLATDTIRRYENGERLPDDFTVTLMAEVSGLSALGVQHLRHRSELAAEALPEVESVSLPQAVLNLLVTAKELQPDVDMLLEIARDGIISPDEKNEFDEILKDLRGLIAAAMAVQYAEGVKPTGDK